ncbi:MAG: phosphatase PAP2 family protein [Prevotella sp.]|nr:phosphatase PAP2 family protein [Prevotella sp.]
MKIVFMVLMSCLVTCKAIAQDDSLKYSSVKIETLDNTHNIKLKHLIAPTVCLGVGILSIGSDWLKNQNLDINEELREGIDSKFSIDDYSQYMPALSVYGLNLCGIKGVHDFKDRTMILAMSWLTMSVVAGTMKHTIREMRPDGTTHNSFPSGHTAMAFMGAEFLYQEYKNVSPWIGVAGYAVAAGTGFFRMYNNRHWLNDILAGAGIGILSTKLSYWLYPKIFKNADCRKKKSSLQFVAMPYYDGNGAGCSGVVNF